MATVEYRSFSDEQTDKFKERLVIIDQELVLSVSDLNVGHNFLKTIYSASFR